MGYDERAEERMFESSWNIESKFNLVDLKQALRLTYLRLCIASVIATLIPLVAEFVRVTDVREHPGEAHVNEFLIVLVMVSTGLTIYEAYINLMRAVRLMRRLRYLK